jgi:hypothetical protein
MSVRYKQTALGALGHHPLFMIMVVLSLFWQASQCSDNVPTRSSVLLVYIPWTFLNSLDLASKSLGHAIDYESLFLAWIIPIATVPPEH